ncbi:hypothetical protein C8Q80DRAFT_1341220 [Daedaleopsis nitida]|nr:hypothetical protein C8Q80DRAFT_1341220 [Daedaleopsis nitida]
MSAQRAILNDDILTEIFSHLSLTRSPVEIHSRPACSFPVSPKRSAPRCLNLENVYVRLPFEQGELALLAQAPELRTFAAEWVSTEVLEHLGQSLHLQKLDIRIGAPRGNFRLPSDAKPDSPLAVSPSANGLFRELRKLKLSASDGLYVKAMIAAISSPVLSSIDVRLREKEPRIIRQGLRSLPTVATSLRSLVIGLPFGAYDPTRIVVFEDVAPPLYELHALESLQVDIDERLISVTDADLERMAASWPHIISLYITGRTDYASMLGLMQHCRSLVTCLIPVRDITDADLQQLERETVSAPPQRQILQLAIFGCKFGRAEEIQAQVNARFHDPARLVRILRRMFPSLDDSRVFSGKCDSVEALLAQEGGEPRSSLQKESEDFSVLTSRFRRLMEYIRSMSMAKVGLRKFYITEL